MLQQSQKAGPNPIPNKQTSSKPQNLHTLLYKYQQYMARKYRVISALLGSIHATDDTRKNKNETWQMNSRNNLHTHTRSMSFAQGGST